MGFFDAFRRPRSLLAAATATAVAATPAPAAKPESHARGIPGNANFQGRLIVEPNEALRDQSGYGRAGTYDPGAWKEIALSNPYVTAGLDFILGPVADARVDVEPAPKESGVPESAAKGQADFLRQCLTEKFKLTTHLEAAARGFLLSGFALFEPVFGLQGLAPGEAVADDAAQEAGAPPRPRDLWVLKSLEQRLPNSLDMAAGAWLESDDGKLTGIKQSGPRGMTGAWARPILSADKVLLYSWKREGNNWQGESQLRSAWYIAGRVMPMLLKLAGVTVQREGAGLPQVKRTDENADDLTPKQREELLTFIANSSFHESAGAIMPKGWEVEWVFSPGANKTFIIDLWKSLGLVVLQQLGAQQLTLGTDNTGSRSVGEVHDARAMAFVRKVLAFSEGVLNGDSGEWHTGITKRLIDFNFGPQLAYPRVKLTAKRPEMSPSELASSAKQLKDAGLLTPTVDDENVVRERTGFAPITEEERTAAKEKAAALAPPSPFGGGNDGPEPGGKPQFGKKLQASMPRNAWKPWRPLRASEAKLRLSELDAYFIAQREAYEGRARVVFSVMMGTAAPQVSRAMQDGEVSPEEVAAVTFNTKRLDALNREFLAEVRAAGARFASEELGPTVLRAAEPDDEAEAEAQAVLDAQASALLRRQMNRARAELEREAIDALRTGDDADVVVSRALESQLESGAFRADAGSVLTKTFNVGREEAARMLGGVETVELSAILDSATCEACVAADGSEAEFGSAEHDRLVPPVRDCAGRDSCRCLLVYRRGDA